MGSIQRKHYERRNAGPEPGRNDVTLHRRDVVTDDHLNRQLREFEDLVGNRRLAEARQRILARGGHDNSLATQAFGGTDNGFGSPSLFDVPGIGQTMLVKQITARFERLLRLIAMPAVNRFLADISGDVAGQGRADVEQVNFHLWIAKEFFSRSVSSAEIF